MNLTNFNTLNNADGFIIQDVPWVGYCLENKQVVYCKEEGKKLKLEDGSIVIDEYVAPPEMVDLGLPSGTLWAKTNLGAQTETDYGDYYQWASTTPLHVEGTTVDPAADWNLCPYTTDGNTFTKYTGSDYSTLQSDDDVVTVTYGGSYRMPTSSECQELIDGTDNERTSINGINGYKFMKKSDHNTYIFIPAAGKCGGSLLSDLGDRGYVWSSSNYESYHDRSFGILMSEIVCRRENYGRRLGLSIRAVLSN